MIGAPSVRAAPVDAAIADAARAWQQAMGDKAPSGTFPFTDGERFIGPIRRDTARAFQSVT